MALDSHTQMVAVLGWPIHHSLSPRIHNAAFQAQGLNMAYCAAPVPPEAINAAIQGLAALGFAGANVTLPHKEAAFQLMDECSEAAKAVRAVNTIVCKTNAAGERILYGDNTDVSGFMTPLMPHAQTLAGKSAVIFGAGGAIRAVLFGLLTHLQLKKITLVVRSIEKASALLAHMQPYDPQKMTSVLEWQHAGGVIREAHLLVNGTPKGMFPNVHETVWPTVEDFGTHHLAYDLIYNPAQTRFLSDVVRAGGTAIGGLEMFIGQAAAAYRQWTQKEMPLALVREVLYNHFRTYNP